ncbi:transferrin-binding protein-like solute binding protein [Pasteurella skyensis]|uniref:Transferrin-binding protein-like solute binding protein n=1 Tax=Phocoenobacter skyensis TaxID=97481 RepID=A0AAJ6NB39_9PAST|nr:transferrin-binding protein-like solute binding protein [Pasteurella skyensis]MDP8163327.1 transferrin-binding protein-like solute binding protein [Pasteurella skyensis]MDP8173528.1 transferrin-binding protein-like solute binding protein [Pasteurella skyensis]MDP8177243.1 transferrin-binding protein-like solute binding protein [Pasteurella skyensis]MDP8179743.1 transferrin-binding protein-like solute binding protein [Pasteurella skyensis]MDP8183857.1 transferrin-binding protein-like solute 
MKKLILSTAMALVLTACGSGGSSTSSQLNQSNFAEKEGIAVSEYFFGVSTQSHTHKKGINKLYLIGELGEYKGKEIIIPLIPEGALTNNHFHYLDIKLGNAITKSIISSRYYQYTRFGLLRDPEDKDFLTFFQGIATKVNDLPKGTAIQYRGDALGMVRIERHNFKNPKNNLNDVESGWVEGKSEFTVDFSHKKISGVLKDFKVGENGLNVPTMIISAKSFSGNKVDYLNENTAKGTGELLKAQFYGSKAAELSGQYGKRLDKEKVAFAVFGAKKQ